MEQKGSPHNMLLWLFLAALPCVADLSDWGVEYKPKMICAFEGSTVRIYCTYKHPADVTVNKKMWLFGPKENETSNDQVIAEYLKNGQGVPDRHRVQFLGNKQKTTCDIKISNVSREDSGYYKFRFEGTNHWTQIPGVHVTVRGLMVEPTAREITKNDTVTLRCRATCSLENSASSWFRNGQQLNGTSETLEIQRDDLSNYSCRTGNITSPEFNLSTLNAPMNTEITGHPTNCIVKGTSVTLNCRASANPPSSYTWVKENSSHVGSGEQLNIRNFNESHTGSYHCEATNILGKAKSSAVTLTVYDLSEWGATYEPMTICALEGSTVTISCKYKHPACVTIENEIWLCGPKQNETVNGEEITVYHTKESNVNRRHRQRVQILGNKQKTTCDVMISNLSREDSGYYKFRLEGSDHWTHLPGVNVTVTGLMVEATEEEIKERDTMTLRCQATCSLENSAISWFRNGQQLNGTSETLEIQRDDLSSYSCRTGNIRSPEFNLSTLNHMNPVWFALSGLIILAGLALAVLLFLRKRPKKKSQKNADAQEGKETFNNPVYEGITVSGGELAEHEGEDEPTLNYVSMQF
ncbi:sialoadhesin-like isoform X1 [Polypterus senegalus]|uniref:sialoadhesin-like isoform X1 n=1 Tax=Polypterus senegalus TaxID=55291 RepID=UPI0019632E7F|nr:sialoadhesin-like isoform X1 [Polypterus senegalus]